MYKDGIENKSADSSSDYLEAPQADKIKKELTRHAQTRIDYYYWLNNINDPKVMEYLEAENKYTAQVLKHPEDLQKKLFEEMVGRVKKEEQTVPYKLNGYFYYHRYDAGNEYPVHCRKKGTLESNEEILLDINEMAQGREYISVTHINVSPDNRKLAFSIDYSGGREYEIQIKNLETGELFPGKITGTAGETAWANDSATIFYSKKDDSLRSYKVLRHDINDNTADDVEVYTETAAAFSVYVNKTKSDKYILIGSYSNTATEVRYIDADKPEGELKLISEREKNHEYYVEHREDKFFITTNSGAKNFKLVEVEVDNPSKKNWMTRVPHRREILLERVEVFKNFLVLLERKDGLRKVRIVNLLDRAQRYIEFEEEAYSIYLTSNHEYESSTLRFIYTSLTTPASTYDFNMDTGEKIFLKREEVLGDFDKRNYITERVLASADDGTKIPLSIVYKKGLVKDGNNPLLLTGYGAYGISSDPDFSSVRLSLLNRGFVFAIAHIRGGQEFGRQWYEDGKLLNKKNTFTDFIICAECLIKYNYTNKEKLFAIGGSAGGLLIGAVINMKPGLFKAVIAAVPFVDVVTTMLDENIPLTTGEFDEWGNPDNKEYYDYILSYSPYDNVERKKYPAMLVTAGINDSQVQYWEPAKWVAKLREMKTDDNMLLLHTNMSAGHSGSSGRFERFKVIALEYAFLLSQLGIER